MRLYSLKQCPVLLLGTSIKTRNFVTFYEFLSHLGMHHTFPNKVVQHTLQLKTNNNNGMLVLINVLEFAMVIINYCTALHVVQTSPVTNDPHPVILNITNNSSTLSWTLHTCKRSKIGQMIALFFCSLLINSHLGINSQWISTIDNKIADDISCLKMQSDIIHLLPLITPFSNRCTWSWDIVLSSSFSQSSSC